MKPFKPAVFLAAAACAVLASASALADDKAACVDASLQGQALRNAHKLVEARDQLRACAAATCPAVVQSDCASWLAEVDKALPTVVLAAKNAAGADLVDVKVSVDGQPLVSRLDGQALPMNAGPHTFHFEGPDGVVLDQQVVVREGEKNQAVAVVLGTPAPQPAPPAGDSGQAGHPSGWRTVGWVLGGVGVAGLGVGAAFGIAALSSKNANCSTTTDKCATGTLGGIRTDAAASDVGWIVGGVLLAGGAALVLLSPHGSTETTTGGVRVAPVVTASGGGVLLNASW